MLFLRGVWRAIPSSTDSSWVGRLAQKPPDAGPLGDVGSLVASMLEKGVTRDEIARFSRIIGYETAFDVLYLIADPHDALVGLREPSEIAWGLFLTDPETSDPIEELSMLHEDILTADPDGSEMRPPPGP